MEECLLFHMRKSFSDAAHPSFSLRPESSLLVPVNGYGILTETSKVTSLVTAYTNICAGFALMAEDGSSCALAHIYADNKFFANGQDAVERHARIAWDRLQASLPDHTKYRAVAFGGVREFLEMPEETGVSADEYILARQKADYVFDRTKHIPRYVALNEQIDSMSAATSTLNNQDTQLLDRLIKTRQEIADESHQHLFQGAYLRTGLEIGAQVSTWIGNAFYDAAMQSGHINECEDLRFIEAPHDAVVDLDSMTMTIARSEKDSLINNPYQSGLTLSPRLFNDFEIHLV